MLDAAKRDDDAIWDEVSQILVDRLEGLYLRASIFGLGMADGSPIFPAPIEDRKAKRRKGKAKRGKKNKSKKRH